MSIQTIVGKKTTKISPFPAYTYIHKTNTFLFVCFLTFTKEIPSLSLLHIQQARHLQTMRTVANKTDDFGQIIQPPKSVEDGRIPNILVKTKIVPKALKCKINLEFFLT